MKFVLSVDMQQNYLSYLYTDCTSKYPSTFGKLTLVLDRFGMVVTLLPHIHGGLTKVAEAFSRH
jgi:hypothetical protein